MTSKHYHTGRLPDSASTNAYAFPLTSGIVYGSQLYSGGTVREFNPISFSPLFRAPVCHSVQSFSYKKTVYFKAHNLLRECLNVNIVMKLAWAGRENIDTGLKKDYLSSTIVIFSGHLEPGGNARKGK